MRAFLSGCALACAAVTGCSGAGEPELPGVEIEVDALARRCDEGGCGLDRPIAPGAVIDVEIAPLGTEVPADLDVVSSDESVVTVVSVAPLDDAEDADADRRTQWVVRLHAIETGTAQLSVRDARRQAIAEVPVEVAAPTALSIDLGPARGAAEGPVDLWVGDDLWLVADGHAADGSGIYLGANVTWTVSDPAIAPLASDEGDTERSTDEAATVTGVTPGEITLEATSASLTTHRTIRVVPAAPP